MKKKLTLSINEELVKFAHEFSRKSRQSISQIVEQYFQRLKKESEVSDLSDETAGLYGIFSDRPIPSKRELREYAAS